MLLSQMATGAAKEPRDAFAVGGSKNQWGQLDAWEHRQEQLERQDVERSLVLVQQEDGYVGGADRVDQALLQEVAMLVYEESQSCPGPAIEHAKSGGRRGSTEPFLREASSFGWTRS